jgi:ABC-2 type transport system permease protein
LLFATSTLLALMLAASLVAAMTVSLFWTISGEGINRLTSPLIFFFSGIVIPLPLFPSWLQGLLAVLPFRGLIDTPFRIYMGVLTREAAAGAFVNQIVWTAVFVMLGRMILTRGVRRLVVQGG